MNFFSDFGAGLAEVCTLLLELYVAADFLGTATGVVSVEDFSGVATTSAAFDFIGVPRLLRMFTFPLVSCSALMTSAGKLTITLLFVRYLSE